MDSCVACHSPPPILDTASDIVNSVWRPPSQRTIYLSDVCTLVAAFLAQNLTRSIGISNFNQAQIEAIMSDPSTTVKPAVNQCYMSLKQHDDATIQFCKGMNITYESFDAIKGCDFTSATLKQIATAHSVGYVIFKPKEHNKIVSHFGDFFRSLHIGDGNLPH